MRKLRSGEIVEITWDPRAVFFTKCAAWVNSKSGKVQGEEVGLWGTAVLTPVALKAWRVSLRLYFWTGLGFEYRELIHSTFFKSSTKTTVADSKGETKRGDCHTTETIAVMLFEIELATSQRVLFPTLGVLFWPQKPVALNLTTFGWTAQRRRLKHLY